MRQDHRGAGADTSGGDESAVAVSLLLSARSFLHGRPRLQRALAPLARPVLRHLPRLQADPALAALDRWAQVGDRVTFVQLGAHDGLTNDPLHEFVISRPGWTGVVVEPVPEHFAALQATYACVAGRVRFERAVLGSSSGRVPFYRFADAPGMPAAMRQVGSLSRAHVEQYAAEAGEHAVVVEEQLAGTTLRALVERHGLTHIDLLHMDIEGAEPLVLSQIDFDATWAPQAMLFEHHHLSEPDFKHWTARLRAAGYALEHGRQDTWAHRTIRATLDAQRVLR
jgi:FkbM family methyltransferase